MSEKKIIASISGGKDSLAALVTHVESGGRCDGAIYRIAARCGISVTEALFMPPGELFDLWELYLRDHGKRDKEGV